MLALFGWAESLSDWLVGPAVPIFQSNQLRHSRYLLPVAGYRSAMLPCALPLLILLVVLVFVFLGVCRRSPSECQVLGQERMAGRRP